MNLITKIRRVLAAPFRSLRDKLDSYVDKRMPSASEVAEFWGIDNVAAAVVEQNPHLVETICDEANISTESIAEKFDAYQIADNIDIDLSALADQIEVSDVAQHVEVDPSDVAQHVEVDPSDVAQHVEVDLCELAEQIGAENVAEHVEVEPSEVANHIDINDIEVDYDTLIEGICYETLGEAVFEGVKEECVASVAESIDVEEMKQEILHTINLDDLVERVTSKVVQSIKSNEGGNGLSFTLTVS
jgi:hypothetical protein